MVPQELEPTSEGTMSEESDAVRAFEERYAQRSGMTVEQLHSWGRYGEPCDCGHPTCEGFQMSHAWEDAIVERQNTGTNTTVRPGASMPLG